MAGNPNWRSGSSGNPTGRPKKERALSAILAAAGNVTVLDDDGKKTSRARQLAADLWALALDRTLKPDDRIAAAKLIYSQVDGPPKQEVDITTTQLPGVMLPEEDSE
jgi:hypothetical protein